PIRSRKETCFFPTRPAMGESEPIGANRWHRRSENRVVGATPPLGTLMIPQNISHFHLVFPPVRRYTGRRRPGRRAPVKNYHRRERGRRSHACDESALRRDRGWTGRGGLDPDTGGAGSRDLDLRG